MSEPSSAPSAIDELLADFLLEYDRAAEDAERNAIVARWCVAHPDLANEIRELAKMRIRMPRAADPPDPTELPDFDVLGVVGRGGMGKVYKAKQRSLNRVVALKIARGRLSPDRQIRFLREQRVLARLHQTHIVPIHTAGQHGPWQYFAMAYIEGTALSNLVRTTFEREATRPDDATPTRGPKRLQRIYARFFARHPDARTLTLGAMAGESIRLSQLTTLELHARPTPSENGAASTPPPVFDPSIQLALSLDYFRSVARAIADAAEALHHAHAASVLHRDIKPGNLLVDKHGQCWLIDFGLARTSEASGGRKPPGSNALPDTEGLPGGLRPPLAEPTPTVTAFTKGIVGTPQYMAPEQFAEHADERSDVWGLGVTLYELLTLRRAFDGPNLETIQKRVTEEEARPLELLVGNVPADLRAICRKAMRKDAGQRYATAQELADDLRRWLHFEPTTARPARTPRRVAMWARRNPGWAAAIAFALLAGAAGAFGQIRMARAETVLAEERANAANELAESQRRDVLIQRLQRMRLTSHDSGWMDNAWDLVREAVKIPRDDATIRDLAAGSLIGLDARISKRFEKHDTEALAWDATGKRLLIGSSLAHDGQRDGPAFLWDSTTDQRIVSQQRGRGPVAFRADGTPVQLVVNPKDAGTLLLWDVAGQRQLQTFRLPLPADAKKDAKPTSPSLSLAPDGKYVAATIKLPDGKPLTAIWDADTGQLLHQMPETPTELVFTPAAGNKPCLFAAGYEDGRVAVHSLPKGEQVAAFRPSRHRINALAFGRKVRHSVLERAERAELRGWLVTAGDAGANVSVWNLATQDRVGNYYGAIFEVLATAFNPDGVTVVSCGRNHKNVWDIATGRLLLEAKDDQHYTLALTFSPDGKQLATANYAAFGSVGGVTIWEFTDGRGVQSLRGLAGTVQRVQFSQNGQFIAAQTDSWDVAIWDRQSGRLLHVLEVPRGIHSDNASFAFNADASRFVFASGEYATMWDVATGEQLDQWKLPPGLGDSVVFHPSGKFLLFRCETKDGRLPPAGRAHPKLHPRVCRVRNLSGPKPTEPIWQTDRFSWHVFARDGAPDGSSFVVEGMDDPIGKERAIRAFDSLTGAEMWSLPSLSATISSGAIHFTPDSRVLNVTLDAHNSQAQLVEARTGKLLATLHRQATYMAPQGTYRAHTKDGVVHRWDGDQPLFKPEVGLVFNLAGTHAVGATPDGTVLVYDMQEVQKRLAAVGLGW